MSSHASSLTTLATRTSRACLRAAWFGPAILILAGTLPYLNSLWGEFHFDDNNQIVERSDLGQPSVLLRSVSRSRTLTFTTFALNYRLHGLEWMPGWHLVNITLHVACVLALYWLMRLILRNMRPAAPRLPKRLGKRGTRSAAPLPGAAARAPAKVEGSAERADLAAFISALLFAVHPLASEPVNYIQARAVILYTLFTLLATCGAVLVCSASTAMRTDAARRQQRGKLLAGAVLACGSLLLATVSKEVGVFFALACPLVYALIFWVPQVRWRPRTLLIAVGCVVLAAAAVITWAHVSGMGSFIQQRLGVGFFWQHLRAQLIVFWQYVLLAVLPLPSLLSVDHNVPLREYALSDGDVMAALLGLVGLVLLPALLLVRTRPTVAFLLILLPLGLAPYFIMSSLEMMVEYRFYLPLAAFCGLAGMGLAALWRRHESATGVPNGGWLPWGTAGLVLALAVMTAQRNVAWRTDLMLWTDAYEKTPRKARTMNGLAWALLKDKTAPDPKRALRLAEESFNPRRVDLPPGYNPFMWDTLAEAYFANGMVEQAISVEREIVYKHGWGTEWFLKQLARFQAATRPAQ